MSAKRAGDDHLNMYHRIAATAIAVYAFRHVRMGVTNAPEGISAPRGPDIAWPLKSDLID